MFDRRMSATFSSHLIHSSVWIYTIRMWVKKKTYVNYFLSYSTFDAEISVILYSLVMIHNWLDALVSKEILMSYLAFQFFLWKKKRKKKLYYACFDADKYIFWRHYNSCTLLICKKDQFRIAFYPLDFRPFLSTVDHFFVFSLIVTYFHSSLVKWIKRNFVIWIIEILTLELFKLRGWISLIPFQLTFLS